MNQTTSETAQRNRLRGIELILPPPEGASTHPQ